MMHDHDWKERCRGKGCRRRLPVSEMVPAYDLFRVPEAPRFYCRECAIGVLLARIIADANPPRVR